MKTSEQIKVRNCSIICNDHLEWGTWGVMEDRGEWFEIHGRSGSRVLYKDEADKFWSIQGGKLVGIAAFLEPPNDRPDLFEEDFSDYHFPCSSCKNRPPLGKHLEDEFCKNCCHYVL